MRQLIVFCAQGFLGCFLPKGRKLSVLDLFLTGDNHLISRYSLVWENISVLENIPLLSTFIKHCTKSAGARWLKFVGQLLCLCTYYHIPVSVDLGCSPDMLTLTFYTINPVCWQQPSLEPMFVQIRPSPPVHIDLTLRQCCNNCHGACKQ